MTNTSRWMFNNTLTILLQYLCYLLIAEQFRSFESELPRKMLCKNISRLSRSHHSCEEDQVWLYRWWELAVKYEFFFFNKTNALKTELHVSCHKEHRGTTRDRSVASAGKQAQPRETSNRLPWKAREKYHEPYQWAFPFAWKNRW